MGLTLAQLTDAIRHKVDVDMETSVAETIAEHALGFFGFSNRIIDNALEPTDRNLFYQLQDYDLLTTESEETTLWDGREWRIHYWKFKSNAEELARLAAEGHANKDIHKKRGRKIRRRQQNRKKKWSQQKIFASNRTSNTKHHNKLSK